MLFVSISVPRDPKKKKKKKRGTHGPPARTIEGSEVAAIFPAPAECFRNECSGDYAALMCGV